MYDELIKRLRVSCESCKLWDGYKCCLKGECSAQKSLQAADAIEELQLYMDLYKDLTEKGEKIAREVINKYPKWIPVTERLPEDYERVLTCDEHENIHIFPHLRHFKYPFGIRPEDPRFFMPKWWMPLPQPPESEDV